MVGKFLVLRKCVQRNSEFTSKNKAKLEVPSNICAGLLCAHVCAEVATHKIWSEVRPLNVPLLTLVMLHLERSL